MSGAPYLVPHARGGYKAGHAAFIDHMMKDGLEDAYEVGRPMGTFGEDTATAYGFSRAEQDAYALETVKRAQGAVTEGRFARKFSGCPRALGRNPHVSKWTRFRGRSIRTRPSRCGLHSD